MLEILVLSYDREKVDTYEIRVALEIGDKVPILQLPSEVVRISGNKFSIHLDPNNLPEDYINDDGRVDIGVNVILPEEKLMGFTHETVRFLKDTNKTPLSWIDPLIDVETFDQVKNYLADKEKIPELVKTNVELFDAPGLSEFTKSDVSKSEDESIGLFLKTKIGEADVWATVGYSLPLSGNPGNFIYEGGHSTKYGGGIRHSTAWSASGSYTRSSVWGMSWLESTSQRAHNVQVRYHHYSNDVGASTWDTFEPEVETGGTQTTTVTRPNYTQCAPVSTGTWYRESSTGNSLNLSTGVKAVGAIGIDLSMESNYSTKRKIQYKVNDNGRQVCGNDNVPSQASIVMLK